MWEWDGGAVDGGGGECMRGEGVFSISAKVQLREAVELSVGVSVPHCSDLLRQTLCTMMEDALAVWAFATFA